MPDTESEVLKEFSETIKVLVFPVGKPPLFKEIPDTLAAMQNLVDGYIELVRLVIDGREYDLYCNEEGKLENRLPNRRIPGDIVVGQFFVSKGDGAGGQASLDDADVARVTQYFQGKEVF